MCKCLNISIWCTLRRALGKLREYKGGLTVLVPTVDHDKNAVNLSDNRDNDPNHISRALSKWNK